MVPTKNALDVSKIFLTYVAFNGDADKTAVTLEMPVEDVRALAVQERWHDKLANLNKLQGDSKEVQIQLNRAVNYVQGHRCRSLVDRLLNELLSQEDLLGFLTVAGKNGAEFKARAITDLIKAAETAQLMTARALGDTVGERIEGDDKHPGSSIALQVMKAMNEADQLGIDSVEIVRKQITAEAAPAVV